MGKGDSWMVRVGWIALWMLWSTTVWAQGPGSSPWAKLYMTTADSVIFLTGTSVEPEKKAISEFLTPSESEQEAEKHTNGTGFLIHPAGYVVTNAHGVLRCVTSIVELRNGSRYPAEILAIRRNQDIALLKIEPKEPLSALSFETNLEICVGDPIATIGCPPGLKHTFSHGIISGVERSTVVTDMPGLTLKDLLQTDAPINPGMSGGPWLNESGLVLGMTVSKQGNADNLAFGIRLGTLRQQIADMLRRHLEEHFTLETTSETPPTLEECLEMLSRQAGETVGAFTLREAAESTEDTLFRQLGFSIESLSEEQQAEYGLRVSAGVLLTEVDEARFQGLQHPPKVGDILVRVDGRRPKDKAELVRLLRPFRAGEMLDMVFLRIEKTDGNRAASRIDMQNFPIHE